MVEPVIAVTVGLTLKRSNVSPRNLFVPMRFSNSPSPVKIWTNFSMMRKASFDESAEG